MKLIRIYQIAAHARDIDEAINFYRDMLGAEFLGKFDSPGLAFFDFSGVRLLLETGAPKTTLYFEVDQIDQVVADVLGISLAQVNDELSYGSIREWDSLNHVNLMLALEREYGAEIDEDRMVELTSVEAIRRFVLEPQGEAA